MDRREASLDSYRLVDDEELVERVGEGRELGFAILLTCISAIIDYRLDIEGVQRSVNLSMFLLLIQQSGEAKAARTKELAKSKRIWIL